jgi:hypothetical protein
MLKGDNYSGGSFQGVGEAEDEVDCDEIEVVEEDEDHIIMTSSRTGHRDLVASHFQHLQEEEEDDDRMSSVEHDYDSSLMNEHIAAGNNLFSRQMNDISGNIFLDEDD